MFSNYGTFKRYGTRGMVHGARVKIMVRLQNYGIVWQRCRKETILRTCSMEMRKLTELIEIGRSCWSIKVMKMKPI